MSVNIRCTTSPEITAEERELLLAIKNSRRYAVANFELRSSKNDEIYTGAMENVHLLSADEGMEPVVERGELLEQLQEKGLIVLCYDLRVYVKSDYVIFKESALYHQLEEAVQEAKEQDFTFDIAHITKGLAALTVKGRYALENK